MAYNTRRKSWVGTPTNACGHPTCKHVDQTGLAEMLISTVSRCHTTGESEDHTVEKASKGSTVPLKNRSNVTRS